MKESKRISVAEDNKILSKKNLDLQTRYNSLMKEAMGMREALSMIAYNEAPVENIGLASKNISKSAIASFDRLLRANGN